MSGNRKGFDLDDFAAGLGLDGDSVENKKSDKTKEGNVELSEKSDIEPFEQKPVGSFRNEDFSEPEVPVKEEKTEEVIVKNDVQLAEYLFALLGHLEHNFIFRKLGVVFDYTSKPDEFPRKTLPRYKDISSGMPNRAGIGSGIAESLCNTSLLLCGYFTRLELGLSRIDEDRFMDRMIAGLIRFGTTGPKGMVVRGISSDGKSYYPVITPENYTYYAHAIYRAVNAIVVSPDSQGKLKDIFTKMIRRLSSDNYVFPVLGNDTFSLVPDDEKFFEPEEWKNRIRLLHILAVVYSVTGDEQWLKEYKKYIRLPDGNIALKSEIPEEFNESGRLLSLQIALSDISEIMDGEEVVVINLLKRKIAYRMLPSLDKCLDFNNEEPIEEAVLDWRNDFDSPVKGDTEADIAGEIFSKWPRIKNERELVRPSTQAMLCLMLSGDEQLVEENASKIAECIASVKWDTMWDVGSISALVEAHALGHEKGLWDDSCEISFTSGNIGEGYGYEFDEGYKSVDDSTSRGFAKGRTKPLYPDFIENREQKKSRRKGGTDRRRKTRKRKRTRKVNKSRTTKVQNKPKGAKGGNG